MDLRCDFFRVTLLLYGCILIYIILGLSLIGVAANDLAELQYIQLNYVLNIVFIGIGLVACISAPWGCYGLLKLSINILTIFAGCLVVSIFMDVISVVAWSMVRTSQEHELEYIYEMYYSFYKSKQYVIVDDFHYKYGCCGKTGAKEYKSAIPFSCCPTFKFDMPSEKAKIAHRKCLDRKTYFTEGCVDLKVKTYQIRSLAVTVITVISIINQIFGVIEIWWLIKEEKAEQVRLATMKERRQQRAANDGDDHGGPLASSSRMKMSKWTNNIMNKSFYKHHGSILH